MRFVFNPIRPPSNCDEDDPRIDDCIDEMLLEEMFKDCEVEESES